MEREIVSQVAVLSGSTDNESLRISVTSLKYPELYKSKTCDKLLFLKKNKKNKFNDKLDRVNIKESYAKKCMDI